MSFDDSCEILFNESGPYWHLCTPGEFQSVIFKEREDFVFGMNLVAWCVAHYEGAIKIYTFQLMSNHFHFVLSCDYNIVYEFFALLKKRLSRYLAARNSNTDIKKLECNIFEVKDLQYMRTVIAYVNRNGYLVDRDSTPYNYQWGANRFFFAPAVEYETRTYLSRVPKRKLGAIFSTHEIQFPETYYFTGNYVSPYSYCRISEAEQLYRNAHDYFHFVSRRVESFSDIAKELGDYVAYTDEEIYAAAVSISMSNYKMKSPKLLGVSEKMQLAKDLKYKYNASNKQMKRVLGLDERLLNELFPVPAGFKTSK